MWKGLLKYSRSNSVQFYIFNYLIILKNIVGVSVLYLYKSFYFIIKCPVSTFFKVYKNLNLVKIRYHFIPKSFFFNNKIFNILLKSLFIFFFKRIKFTGLGYYMYKSKINSLGMQFNYSHRLNFFFKHAFIIRSSKKSWLFFNLNKPELIESLKLLKSKRPINCFTGTGIRFTKQIVYVKNRKKVNV